MSDGPTSLTARDRGGTLGVNSIPSPSDAAESAAGHERSPMKTHKAVLALSLAAMVAGLLAPAAVLARSRPTRRVRPAGRPPPARRPARHGPGWVTFAPHRHFSGRAAVTSPRTGTSTAHSCRACTRAFRMRRRTSPGPGTTRRPSSTAPPSATTTAPLRLRCADRVRSSACLRSCARVRFAPARPLLDDHVRRRRRRVPA